MHARARTAGADAIILDLEDGVAPPHKAAAREHIARALAEGFPPRLRVYVRPNAAASGLFETDLLAVLGDRVTGIVLPKVAGADEVQDADAWLRAVEIARGMPAGSLRFIVLIETPPAVLETRAIAAASPRVVGVAFGADDLAAGMGLPRAAADVAYPRAHVALAAHAAGVEAIDIVYTAVHDLDGCRAEARAARALGYTGKQVIHPRQVAVANEVFAPTPEEVAWAQAVIGALEAAPRGVIMVEGRMVDAPVIRQARRVLERAALVAERGGAPAGGTG